MVRVFILLMLCAISLLATLATAAPITIETVPVGNAGNADDVTGFGGVSYNYRIGTTEVTNDQYAAFLNEKAKSNSLDLFDPDMDGWSGGIRRSGVWGSYTYAVNPNMGNKPVYCVTWYNAIRFINWLHNGQGAGDTETGAYTIGPLVPGAYWPGQPINGLSITRNPGAKWFLPSEDEWYKAAYYQPSAEGGDTDSYWLYSTRSNSAPTIATANVVGDISNPGANVANYWRGAIWQGKPANVTTVGSAGQLSQSFYGTFDQSGNVEEWTEALVGSSRVYRGGSNRQFDAGLRSTRRGTTDPLIFLDPPEDFGFRVATIPEPSSLALAAFGLAGLAAWGYRRRAINR